MKPSWKNFTLVVVGTWVYYFLVCLSGKGTHSIIYVMSISFLITLTLAIVAIVSKRFLMRRG